MTAGYAGTAGTVDPDLFSRCVVGSCLGQLREEATLASSIVVPHGNENITDRHSKGSR